MEEKIKNIVNDVLKEYDVWVSDVLFNNNELKITLDSSSIINLEKVTFLSKIINKKLDEIDLIKNSYVVDISSKERGNE